MEEEGATQSQDSPTLEESSSQNSSPEASKYSGEPGSAAREFINIMKSLSTDSFSAKLTQAMKLLTGSKSFQLADEIVKVATEGVVENLALLARFTGSIIEWQIKAPLSRNSIISKKLKKNKFCSQLQNKIYRTIQEVQTAKGETYRKQLENCISYSFILSIIV